MNEVPDFSGFADEYAAARPRYPSELFDWLAGQAPTRETAWDAGTGNGQAAWGLAERFDRVIATDVSTAQLEQARRHPQIDYRIARAEASGLPDRSIDLAVSSAAVHWFDLPRYYDELRRVLRPGGVSAVWTYHVAGLNPELETILMPFYRILGKYFAPGVRLVDDHYEAITLPGEELVVPSFHASARWNAAQVLRYVRTWSGVQVCIEATRRDPVLDIAPAIEDLFGGPDAALEIRWPLYVRAARR